MSKTTMGKTKKNEAKAWAVVGVIAAALFGWYVKISREPVAWSCQDAVGDWHTLDLPVGAVTQTPEGWVLDAGDRVLFFDTCERERKQ